MDNIKVKMTIPDFQSIMFPLLNLISDKLEHSSKEAEENLSQYFNLTRMERDKLFESGQKKIFYTRVYWAITYLKHSGLLRKTRRGHFTITNRGIEVLHNNDGSINKRFLTQFPEFNKFIKYYVPQTKRS